MSKAKGERTNTFPILVARLEENETGKILKKKPCSKE
jgi:hypothetical protein